MSSIGTYDMAARMEKWEENATGSPSQVDTDDVDVSANFFWYEEEDG